MKENEVKSQAIQMTAIGQSGFNVKKLIGRVLDYWYWYVLSLLICISYAWFSVHYATPMFKVKTEIIVQDDKSAGSPLTGSSSGGFDFSSIFGKQVNMYNEIAILQTTDLAKEAVNELGLNTIYYHKGSIRQIELYKASPFSVQYFPNGNTFIPVKLEIHFQHSDDNHFTMKIGKRSISTKFYDTLHLPQGSYFFSKNSSHFDTNASYIVVINSPEATAAAVSSNLLSELMVNRGTILRLTYNTNLPRKGEEVLGAIARAYINRSLNTKNQISDNTIEFINSRIGLVGNELGNIETTIQQFKQNNNIADLTTQSQQLISNSSSFFQQQGTLDVQLQVLSSMLAYVENENNNSRPVPALLNSDATFSGIVSSYNAMQVERDKLLLTVKEGNPLTKNLDMQLKGLRGDMIHSLRSQQEALQISRQQLIAKNNQISSQIRSIPVKERQFLDFSREQDVKQALYLFLLQKKEETAITKASNISNASIIEAPRSSNVPYDPNMPITLTMGVLLGLIIPTGAIMLRFMLNNKILTKEDITDATPATILTEIGHSTKPGLLNVEEEGRSIIAEQFRIFRTNMDFTLGAIKNPIVVVTSTMSGEGKSFIAANLGQIYAISGKKVLLMEMDLRRPKLSSMLNMPNESGFSNYIIANNPIQQYIKKVHDQTNLYLLSSGPIPPNPAELLMSERMEDLFRQLKADFDLIILDTAPLGAVADAQILGKYSNISLYILRQRYSIKNALEVVNDALVNNRLPSLYLVINDVKAGASYKYGYGYGYNNGYGYYSNDKQKRKLRLK